MTYKLNLAKPHWPIVLLMIGYIFLALYLGVILQYNFLRSDVLGYWQDSLALQTPFHQFHVPFYPLLIAILRGVTFAKLSPVGLMMSINLGAFLISSFIIYRILQAGGASDELAAIGTFLFGLWPFVGITYTVAPLADLPAMFFFLAGLYLLQGSRRLPAALFFGLSMVTHKAMWLLVGFLIISDFLYRREYISKQNMFFIGITLLPIGILWLSGSFYHNSVTWLFSSNLEVEVASKGSMPILDGVLGTFVEGDIKGKIKGILLMVFAAISAITLYLSVRLKYRYYHYGVVISFFSLILFIILNQHEIWAAIRFGRLLAIPLVLIANNNLEYKKISWWNSPAIITFLLFLFLSQFAYAWYMARIYYG